MTRKLTVGFYRPSSEFRRQPEHVAVMDEETGQMIALTGYSDFHDRDAFVASLAEAAVCSVAWDALKLLRKLAHSSHPLAREADKIGEAVPEALRGLVSASELCSMWAFNEVAIAYIAKQLEDA